MTTWTRVNFQNAAWMDYANDGCLSAGARLRSPDKQIVFEVRGGSARVLPAGNSRRGQLFTSNQTCAGARGRKGGRIWIYPAPEKLRWPLAMPKLFSAVHLTLKGPPDPQSSLPVTVLIDHDGDNPLNPLGTGWKRIPVAEDAGLQIDGVVSYTPKKPFRLVTVIVPRAEVVVAEFSFELAG